MISIISNNAFAAGFQNPHHHRKSMVGDIEGGGICRLEIFDFTYISYIYFKKIFNQKLILGGTPLFALRSAVSPKMSNPVLPMTPLFIAGFFFTF